MKRTNSQKGITLIALIITIVVLLILAVVTINSIQGDGIIRYAQNAADNYTAKANEEQGNLNTLFDQIEGSLSEEEATWTKTSTGDLAIGSKVKHIETEEEFFVIGGDTVGKEIDSSTEKVILLAKNNLKADGSAQETIGAMSECVFSTVENLTFTEGENLNNNSTIQADTKSAVYKAMKYGGETLGVTTGRLMLKSEAEALKTANSDILYGKSQYSSTGYLNYWCGSASGSSDVWIVHGYNGVYTGNAQFSSWDYRKSNIGVRPVVEILKSDIS